MFSNNTKRVNKKEATTDQVLNHMSDLLFLCKHDDEKIRVWAQKQYRELHAMIVTTFLVGEYKRRGE